MAPRSATTYLSEGDSACAKGDADRAAGLYRKAIEADAGCYQAWTGLAKHYSAAGLADLAKKTANRALGIRPSYAPAWQALAEIELKEKNFSKALKLIKIAAKLDPHGRMSDSVMARIYHETGNLAAEEKHLARAAAKNPDFALAYFPLAKRLIDSGEFSRLLDIVGQARRSCSAHEWASLVNRLSTVLLAKDSLVPRTRAIFRFYDQLRDLIAAEAPDGRPRAGEASRECFRAYCCIGAYARAFAIAEELLLKNEGDLLDLGNPWLSNRLVPALFWSRHFRRLTAARVPAGLEVWKRFNLAVLSNFLHPDKSEANFSKVLDSLTGRYAWMRYSPACNLLCKGDFARALPEFRRVLQCLPRDPAARCRYGEALICSGNKAAGFREFETACSFEKWKEESAAWKGELHLITGEYGQAIKVLERSRGTFAGGWLGAAYYKAGHIPKAVRCLEAAIKKCDPLDHEVKVWLAEIYRTTGKARGALPLLDDVLRKAPDYDLARFNRALLYSALGRDKEMREDFGRIHRDLLRSAAAGARVQLTPGLSKEAMLKILAHGLEQAGGNRRMEQYFLNIQFPGYAAAARNKTNRHVRLSVKERPAPGPRRRRRPS